MAANFSPASRITFSRILSVSAVGGKNANRWLDGEEYISQPVYGRQVSGESIQCCNKLYSDYWFDVDFASNLLSHEWRGDMKTYRPSMSRLQIYENLKRNFLFY
jgi:hypothetical protein